MPGTQLIRAFCCFFPPPAEDRDLSVLLESAMRSCSPHLSSISHPGAEKNRRGAGGWSVLPISEQHEVRTHLTESPGCMHLPAKTDWQDLESIRTDCAMTSPADPIAYKSKRSPRQHPFSSSAVSAPRDFANGIRRCPYSPDAAHKGCAFSRSPLRANTKIATS